MHAGDTFGGKSHTEMDHNTPVYLIYLVKTRLKKSLHWGVHNHGAQQTNVATCSLYVLYPRTLLSEWRIINTSRTVDKMLLTTWALTLQHGWGLLEQSHQWAPAELLIQPCIGLGLWKSPVGSAVDKPAGYSVVGRESADLPTFAWYLGLSENEIN